MHCGPIWLSIGNQKALSNTRRVVSVSKSIGPQSFSSGVDRFLNRVRPWGVLPKSEHPKDLPANQTRHLLGESDRAWFKRLIDSVCDGDATQAEIEVNIA